MPTNARLSNAGPDLLSPRRSIPSRIWGTLVAPVPEPGAEAAGTPVPTTADKLRLFALSFLMLFVELALIRWTGANILYLSYFSNFILLASFLGIGLGFLRADARQNLFPFAAIGLTVLVAFVRIFPVEIDRSGTELIFFGALGTQSGLPPWLTLPVLFLGVAGVMTLIAEGVGRTFRQVPPLEAYRLDIPGSIPGLVS